MKAVLKFDLSIPEDLDDFRALKWLPYCGS